MEKELLIPFLKAAIPQFDWILSDMEKSNGWFNLNENLINNSISLKLQWWNAYEDEKLFKLYQLLMFLDLDDIKKIHTKEDVESLTNEFVNESISFLDEEELSEIRPYTEAEKEEVRKAVEKIISELSDEEKSEFWKKVGFYWLGFYCFFFDLLSLMVHGKSLRTLVKEAKQGNDESYILAVQSDRMVLYLPYFRERLIRAQLGSDTDFLRDLSYRIKNPLIHGKIKHRTLWLMFALLESEGQLDMSLSKLLALCAEVGVYGNQYGIGDENSLGKRRREYKLNQGTRKIF